MAVRSLALAGEDVGRVVGSGGSIGGDGGGGNGGGGGGGKWWGMHTSILRPSTTVPWSFSRARSASALLANVTKPNPCMPRQKGHGEKTKFTNKQTQISCTYTTT